MIFTSVARKVATGCRFNFISDVSASRVESFLAELRRGGASIQTSNFYLQAIKQFARWLVRDRRTGDNPLAHISGGNVDLDRRHDRRALPEAEFTALLEAARGAGPYRKLSGRDRVMLYLVAAYTGLRASELASLTPASFDMDAGVPSVAVEAAYSKHRRRDVLPLLAGLVGPLKEWMADKASKERLWPSKWAEHK
jgi:integrase